MRAYLRVADPGREDGVKRYSEHKLLRPPILAEGVISRVIREHSNLR